MVAEQDDQKGRIGRLRVVRKSMDIRNGEGPRLA